MNMLRHIFSFKLVIVFSLVVFLSPVPKPADARIVECPCKYTEVYNASLAQARALGLNNEVNICNDYPGENLELNAYFFDCATSMTLVRGSMICNYQLLCFDQYEFSLQPGVHQLSPEEIGACEQELRLIARKNRIPCEPL
jgi:hypothetical protein